MIKQLKKFPIQYFYFSFAVSIIGIFLAYLWAGFYGVLIAMILSLLEISLSFDNAVVNASILNKMNKLWQQRFLTWGILIAVVGMRFIFPILIIAIVAKINFSDAINIALTNAKSFNQILLQAHTSLAAFGGMFLFTVFLDFLLNKKRKIFWLEKIELFFNFLAKLKFIKMLLALVVLTGFAAFNKSHLQEILIAGSIGLLIQVLLSGIINNIGSTFAKIPAKFLIKTSVLNFIYLEILDASFSLDGVIGAFAITKDLILIFIGLGIGAVFVRSFTITMVENKVLQNYKYLEHGAHYALGALGLVMLISIKIHVNELITSTIGIILILLAVYSSIKRQ